MFVPQTPSDILFNHASISSLPTQKPRRAFSGFSNSCFFHVFGKTSGEELEQNTGRAAVATPAATENLLLNLRMPPRTSDDSRDLRQYLAILIPFAVQQLRASITGLRADAIRTGNIRVT